MVIIASEKPKVNKPFVRNARFEKKLKLVEKAFGITPEVKKRYVDTDFVIDCNKRTATNVKPKFTD